MTYILPLIETGIIDIVKSEKCFLYDKEGNRYIDLESGVWCVNLGHSHKRINRIITRQLERSMHLGYQAKNELPEQLSQMLLKILRFHGGKSVFLSSGSEAVDLSITIAKHLTGRNKISKLDDSYLSAFGHGTSNVHNKQVVNIPNNDFEKLSSCDFSKMAAFVFEPGTASGMIRLPSTEFIKTLVKKAKANECIIIVDEVTTGIGRTGKWFGFEHVGLAPDIVACGKGLGNGYPVSAVALNKAASREFEQHPFRYAQSHMNDPMGCAIGLGVIKEIDRTNLILKTEEKGILFKSLLKEICSNRNDIKEVRGIGLMLAIEFVDNSQATKVHQYLLSHKILCGIKSNVIRLMPPLVIDHDTINEVVLKIELAINQK